MCEQLCIYELKKDLDSFLGDHNLFSNYEQVLYALKQIGDEEILVFECTILNIAQIDFDEDCIWYNLSSGGIARDCDLYKSIEEIECDYIDEIVMGDLKIVMANKKK